MEISRRIGIIFGRHSGIFPRSREKVNNGSLILTCRMIRNGPLKISKSLKKAENGPFGKNLFLITGHGALGTGEKIAAFCLKLGKNNKTYFVTHIHVSFNMFKCTCIFIHTVLLEIHVRFHVLFYSNLSFFSTFVHFFLRESNWENLGFELGKIYTILHLEWGRYLAPN